MVRTIPKRKIARALAHQCNETFRVGEWAQFGEACEYCCAVCIKPNTKVKILSAVDAQNHFEVLYFAENTERYGKGWVCTHHLTKVEEGRK